MWARLPPLCAAAVCVASLSYVAYARAAEPLPVYRTIAGEAQVYAVRPGDTLGAIAGRFGITTQRAARLNHLADPDRLSIGQRLLLSNQRIVPARLPDGLVINVGDRTLYWFRRGEFVAHFPVGVGRVAWRTPAGKYAIVGRRHRPVWYVPPSIQREMRERGEPVRRTVPPGPDNPLGEHWLDLSIPGYGIHGTNAPRSVGRYTTHGCIRMLPGDIERLYREVPNGTAVYVIDEPIKLARLGDDVVLIEAHPGLDWEKVEAALLVQRLDATGLKDVVDVTAAAAAVSNAWGIPIDVSKARSNTRLPVTSSATGRTTARVAVDLSAGGSR